MKCKHCHIKFKQKRLLQKFCEENDECRTASAQYGISEARKIQEKRKRQQYRTDKQNLKSLEDWKSDLQDVINEIIKYIDKDVPCISSGRPIMKFRNSGHFYSRGANQPIRFNLLNIYNQNISDNLYKGGKPIEFMEGLKEMYGNEIGEEVLGLKAKYPTIKLTVLDIKEKLPIARKIARELKKEDKTYSAEERIELRRKFNTEIGIY